MNINGHYERISVLFVINKWAYCHVDNEWNVNEFCLMIILNIFAIFFTLYNIYHNI